MDEKASDRKDELAKTGQLRQNEAMMKRLFLVFSLVAILTAVCGVHAYVPDPADAYAFENAETLVPRSLSGWIICQNDPINRFDPDGKFGFLAVMGIAAGLAYFADKAIAPENKINATFYASQTNDAIKARSNRF